MAFNQRTNIEATQIAGINDNATVDDRAPDPARRAGKQCGNGIELRASVFDAVDTKRADMRSARDSKPGQPTRFLHQCRPWR
jgi:hypothetical protein